MWTVSGAASGFTTRTTRAMRTRGARGVFVTTEGADDLAPRRLDHQRSVAPANPRPFAYSGAEQPLAFQSRTRSAHFDSVAVMRDSVRPPAGPWKARVYAGDTLPKTAFRQVTWRQGSARAMVSRFARRRVRVGDFEQDLLIEWPDGEAKPTAFSLVAIPGKQSTKQMVRILKQRWRTERVYQDAKGELGLDHFEGRSWRGWNHHVTLALCSYAFVVAEQLRFFSLTTRGARWDDPLAPAA
jgi:hypothetical protein